MYISTLIGSLIAVFVLKWQIISFVLIVLQFVALTWYVCTGCIHAARTPSGSSSALPRPAL
jgi:hypothetical protein